MAGAVDSKYLLTGFVRCGTCGGSIVHSWMGLRPIYRCWYNWSRGRAVCANTLTVPQERADLAVLRAIERDGLDPQVVQEALRLALDELDTPKSETTERQDKLRAELARLDAELTRYAEAIASTGPLDAILKAIKERENRREALRTELRAVSVEKRSDASETDIRATLAGYLTDWKTMMRAEVAEARRVLREVVVDRIVFRPVPRPPDMPPPKGPGRKPKLVYELAGEATLSELFAGLIPVSSVVAPTGFEPVFQP